MSDTTALLIYFLIMPFALVVALILFSRDRAWDPGDVAGLSLTAAVLWPFAAPLLILQGIHYILKRTVEEIRGGQSP